MRHDDARVARVEPHGIEKVGHSLIHLLLDVDVLARRPPLTERVEIIHPTRHRRHDDVGDALGDGSPEILELRDATLDDRGPGLNPDAVHAPHRPLHLAARPQHGGADEIARRQLLHHKRRRLHRAGQRRRETPLGPRVPLDPLGVIRVVLVPRVRRARVRRGRARAVSITVPDPR